ncbi:MAG TPA: hypothetical protein VGL35_04845 [Rhizomicrobium sp.]|jgi:hypothetical protein
MRTCGRTLRSGASAAAIATVAPLLVGGANAAVVISSGATQNISCASGVCAPTAADAVLNAGDLETLLASGNVMVTTTGSGVQAKDIRVAGPVSWGTGSALTLDAYQSLTINRPVSLQGLAGLTLATDAGGNNGVLSFGHHGKVTFANLSSSLTINGTAYTLENSIKSLAAAVAANPSGAFALANSYDAGQDGTYTSVPIPTPFTGTFEGLGNAISHLSINDANDTEVGLFAEIGVTGMLRDIHLVYASVTSMANDAVVGTLAGDSEGPITNATSESASVSAGAAEAGGLVGCLACIDFLNPTILRSFASGIVEGSDTDSAVGGLVGFEERGNIMQSGADAKVSGVYGGGLAGRVEGSIDESFAIGKVRGSSIAGGLIGDGGGTIANSYATGTVKGTMSYTDVGGFAGVIDFASVSDSYSTGHVSGGKGGGSRGGFVGHVGEGTFTDCYWDTTTSGIVNRGAGNMKDEPGITGLTSQQLQSGLPQGFEASVWGEAAGVNDGFPYLLDNPPR